MSATSRGARRDREGAEWRLAECLQGATAWREERGLRSCSGRHGRNRNNVGLTVYFQKFADGSRRLRVFAPLGVLLPRGVGLKIDDKDIGNAPFLRCNTFTCYSQVVADDKLVDQLKNGKTAIFVIFQTEEAGIGIPISLAGFAEGLSGLDQ